MFIRFILNKSYKHIYEEMIKLEEKLDRRLQLVELDILKEFIMVCEKLNLKYFLFCYLT